MNPNGPWFLVTAGQRLYDAACPRSRCPSTGDPMPAIYDWATPENLQPEPITEEI
jgi:hypothetical protein